MQPASFRRDALRRLPHILADLFDEPTNKYSWQDPSDFGVDAVTEAGGRTLLIEIKSSSAPGVVDAAARQLEANSTAGRLVVLVVPFMTPAGMRAADRHHLNWIDLSGNAHLRDDQLRIWVHGRPNTFTHRGRPASAFAPKSSRVARALLLDPSRWWTQKELSKHTELDAGHLSRIVKRLSGDALLERDGSALRPRNPDLLLDAWEDEYRFDRHDVVVGHATGTGLDLARHVSTRLRGASIRCALTGLAAAYAIDEYARFRLVSVYVAGDPREAAETLGLRRDERGANVQLIGPDDDGVFDGAASVLGLICVASVQVYLDLRHLPERANEAADHLRADGKIWRE